MSNNSVYTEPCYNDIKLYHIVVESSFYPVGCDPPDLGWEQVSQKTTPKSP
jgi:hypothetical protein